MPGSRKEVYDPQLVATFHCISRCVRRAFLCGFDRSNQVSYEHRRDWIKARLLLLSEVFAIEVISYAVMSNHLHTVVRTRPDKASTWSDREVALRWRKLFPIKGDLKAVEDSITQLLSDPERIAECRRRLSNLSWFNRCMCEWVARRANKEDDCKGRFWEGRFRSQRLEDVQALVTCCAYVDLNPIRAKIAQNLESSSYTSIEQRLSSSKKVSSVKLLSIEKATFGALTFSQYVELLESTRHLLMNDTSACHKLTPLLLALGIKQENWRDTTEHYGRKFKRITGTLEALKRAAQAMKKQWVHGHLSAKKAFI